MLQWQFYVLQTNRKDIFLIFRTFSTYNNLDVWTGFKWTFWLIISFIFVLSLSDEIRLFYFQFNAILFISIISDFYVCTRFYSKKSCFTSTSLTYKLEILQKMSIHVIISSFQIIEILRIEWFKNAADTLAIGHIWS